MSQCASSEGMTLKPSMTSEPSIINCSGFLVPRMHLLSDVSEPAFLLRTSGANVSMCLLQPNQACFSCSQLLWSSLPLVERSSHMIQ